MLLILVALCAGTGLFILLSSRSNNRTPVKVSFKEKIKESSWKH